MSKIEQKEEKDKFLKTDITPEFFQKDPYLTIRFKVVLKEMEHYSKNCEHILTNLEKSYLALPKNHLEKLPFNYKDKIEKVKQGIKLNQDFYNKVLSLYKPKFDYINLRQEDHEQYRIFRRIFN